MFRSCSRFFGSPKPTLPHGLSDYVQQCCIPVSHRDRRSYAGSQAADHACGDDLVSLCECAPVSANKKKNLPILATPATLQAGSSRCDARESFGAEIVAPIKRNALHFETVCALLAFGKGGDALAVCALLEGRG